MLILGAVRTPSPPPSGHLLRGGSSKEDEDYTFLNEGVIARSTSKKKHNLTGGGWRASQDLARLLDPTPSALPACLPSLIVCYLLMLDFLLLIVD